MRRGTTPTITVRCIGNDITNFSVHLTIQDSSGNTIDIADPTLTLDGEDTLVSARLTQEQTLSLHGFCSIQVRATDGETAVASNVVRKIDVGSILLEGEI